MALLSRSPETTYCALAIFAGLILILMGALLPLSPSLSEKVVLAGMGLVSAAAGIMGLFARSQSQHERDKPEVVQEVKASVKEEVREEVKEVAAAVAKSAAQQVVDQERRR